MRHANASHEPTSAWAPAGRSTVRLVGLHETVSRDPFLGTVAGGRYRIERELGRGGMGVVYAGTHLALDRGVAIKVLPTAHALDPDVLRRFEREARAASKIKHPHVVSVFDLGRLVTGEPYLVMELLEGIDLEQAMTARARLAPEETVALLAPLASALDTLHAEGFVHRDIKPSNVFLARSTRGDVVKLVDFGLATLATPTADAQRLTRAGQVVGTPMYMPPESARGDLCDARGDVYSLAVMAFELLAGAPPFEGEPMAVLLEKLSRPAPSLGEIAGAPYSDEVERVMAAALDRDPARRPASAGAFVASLVQALRTGATRALPARRSTPRSAQSPTRRGVIACAILAAISMSLATVVLAARPRTVRAPAPVSAPVRMAAAPARPPTPSLRVEVVEAPAVVPVETAAPRHAHPRARRAPAPLVVAAPTAPAPTSARVDADQLVRDASSAMVRGEIARAHTLYAQATDAAPRDAAAWRGLGLACERQHLAPEARRAYERYLELAPHAADAPIVRSRLDRLL